MIYSSMTYIIFTLLHNLLDFRQVNLFKTAKYWDSFFTHCTFITFMKLFAAWTDCEETGRGGGCGGEVAEVVAGVRRCAIIKGEDASQKLCACLSCSAMAM